MLKSPASFVWVCLLFMAICGFVVPSKFMDKILCIYYKYFIFIIYDFEVIRPSVNITMTLYIPFVWLVLMKQYATQEFISLEKYSDVLSLAFLSA